MNQEHDEREQARIRALLAAAGRTGRPEAMPADVAARLDATLAALVAERGEQDPGSPTSESSQAACESAPERALRRRRRWSTLLAAAAVASVLGLGVTELVDDGPGGWGADGGEEAMSGAGQGARPGAGTDDHDGRPAVLVLRAPDRGGRTAQVFTCDDGEAPAASTRLRSR